MKKIYPALLCLCTVIFLSGCPEQKETENARPLDVISMTTLRKEVKWLAGEEAKDCGYAELTDIEDGVYGEDKAEIDCCVATNVVQGKPFYVVYEEYSEFSETVRGRGYLINEAGDSSAHTWDRALRLPYNAFECDYIETPTGACSVPSDELPSCVRP